MQENKLHLDFQTYIRSTYSDVVIGENIFDSYSVLEKFEYAREQEFEKYKALRLDEILRCGNSKQFLAVNMAQFNELVDLVRKYSVVPFIGAGLSQKSGFSLWGAFLWKAVEIAQLDVAKVSQALENGQYEEVAEELYEKLGKEWFDDHINIEFGKNETPIGAINCVPELFGGPIITTNFDSLISRSFTLAAKESPEVCTSTSPDLFKHALSRNDSCVLHLHGRAKLPDSRVLSLHEYEEAYGSSAINFDLQLPSILKNVYLNRHLLFLGCSLSNDRTMRLMEEIKRANADQLPKHFALMEHPPAGESSDQIRFDKEKFLKSHNIFPIWYPAECHDDIEDLLLLAAERIINE